MCACGEPGRAEFAATAINSAEGAMRVLRLWRQHRNMTPSTTSSPLIPPTHPPTIAPVWLVAARVCAEVLGLELAATARDVVRDDVIVGGVEVAGAKKFRMEGSTLKDVVGEV